MNAEIVQVDVIPGPDVPPSESNDLPVFPNGFSVPHRTNGHLVPATDVRAQADLPAVHREPGSGLEGFAGHEDVVIGVQAKKDFWR